VNGTNNSNFFAERQLDIWVSKLKNMIEFKEHKEFKAL
jgi:hypothetical protein